ncbi:MAG: hypothetical protein V1782_02840 [Pseudomonadota bacterium]
MIDLSTIGFLGSHNPAIYKAGREKALLCPAICLIRLTGCRPKGNREINGREVRGEEALARNAHGRQPVVAVRNVGIMVFQGRPLDTVSDGDENGKLKQPFDLVNGNYGRIRPEKDRSGKTLSPYSLCPWHFPVD